MTSRHRRRIPFLSAVAIVAAGALTGVLLDHGSVATPSAPTSTSTATTVPTPVRIVEQAEAVLIDQVLPTQPTVSSTTVAPANFAEFIAFCGPAYNAPVEEWQAMVSAGMTIAYPPCSSYEFGRPVPWPVIDGSTRYMGFERWNAMGIETFAQYLANAESFGIKVMAFEPDLWVAADPAAALGSLPQSPALIGWMIPEEPTGPAQVSVFEPLATAMHEAGLDVHITFAGNFDQAIAEAARALRPNLVASDDYTSLAAALDLDARVAAAFPTTPRVAAISTVQFDCNLAQPTQAERDAWRVAFIAQGTPGVLWFTWNVPQLDQFCDGGPGAPWTGGLYSAPA